jgi:polysaccharide biosynthesis/export protein
MRSLVKVQNVARCSIFGVIVSLSAAGCTALPTSGPNPRHIIEGASSALISEPNTAGFDYTLLDIDRSVLDRVVGIGPGSFFKSFGNKNTPPAAIRVGVGDVVQVSIFESSSGGLFIPVEAGSRPGNFVTFPSQMVDRAGTISVPFAGQVKASGRSLSEIQAEIESRLSKRAVEPQAIVALAEQNANEVSVVGDGVGGSRKLKIRPAGERVLDMISKAGGVRYPSYETFVTLQRGKQKTTVYFPNLINNPDENVFVAPGDTLYVYREQQKFVAVGALGGTGQTSGLTGLFAFEQERLSLNEAIAKAGGLLDTRASPSQVFLYRMEYRDTLEALKVDLRKFPEDEKFIPTVYRANYRDPSSFFLAQSFPLRHKDIIYVANAESVELTKFLDFLRTITGTAAGVATDVITIADPNKFIGVGK